MEFDLGSLSTLMIGTTSMALLCVVLLLISEPTREIAVSLSEQLAKMGQREMARSHRACLSLLLSAGGAGLVTAGTVVLKLRIVHAPLTLFGSGLTGMLNFVMSFLLIQVFGFRLATKQSPLLGAALAKRLREFRISLAPDFMQNEIRWSFRTQAFSAAGNLAFVVVATILFHVIFFRTAGIAFLEPAVARNALASLNPWKSDTLVFAAFTGALLWLSTVLGSSVANRFQTFSKGMATALFNVFLAAFLAFVPVIAKGLGLHLDVRHFTLSGGTAAMAAASLGWEEALNSGLASAIIGVLLIGVLNFSVSFALAFLTTWLERRDEDGGSAGLYPVQVASL